MIDTLRNGLRVVGSAVMNSEAVYSLLIGMGWFFLLGWALALLVACVSVFRSDGAVQFAGISNKIRAARLPGKTLKMR